VTYGLLVRNEQDTLIIDGVSPLSVFIPCTAYEINYGQHGGYNDVKLHRRAIRLVYDFPVGGSTPPMILARHDLYPQLRGVTDEGNSPPVEHGMNYRNFMATHEKNAQGQWTGVELKFIEPTDTNKTTIKDFRGYFCPMYWGGHGPLPDYGMVLWNEAGEMLYNSATPLTQLKRYTVVWTRFTNAAGNDKCYRAGIPAPGPGEWFLYTPPTFYSPTNSSSSGNRSSWGAFSILQSSGDFRVGGYSFFYSWDGSSEESNNQQQLPPTQWPMMVVSPFGNLPVPLKIG
jgi:hypothetical protein